MSEIYLEYWLAEHMSTEVVIGTKVSAVVYTTTSIPRRAPLCDMGHELRAQAVTEPNHRMLLEQLNDM